jgi:hypothetical protein
MEGEEMGSCIPKSKAEKQYVKSTVVVMISYLLILSGSVHYAKMYRPQGAALYLLACLPMLPVLAMLATIGIYLRDEKDEFERNLTVRAMLWGIAVTLAVSSFESFLRSFGWGRTLAPFTEFIVFFLTMGLVKMLYGFANRVVDHD